MRLFSRLNTLRSRKSFVVSCLVQLSIAISPLATADVFQWELIDPADPSQGRQESSMLAPDGAGVMPAPFLQAAGLDLTQAWLTRVNLTRADFSNAMLTDADLTGANLTTTNFRSADLTGAYLADVNAPSVSFSSANLTGADLSGAFLNRAIFNRTAVAGADFSGALLNGARFDARFEPGITPAQLATTASYQAGDLSGIELKWHDLSGANLAGQNLSDADFFAANLANVNFTGAVVRGAQFTSVAATFTPAQLYSTASYQAGDLAGVALWGNDLTDWDLTGQGLQGASFSNTRLIRTDFSGANLSNARFNGARFSGANFSDAIIAGADFRGAVTTTFSNLTKEQIYATASYQSGDLQGIILSENSLVDWDLSDQDLTGANLRSSSLVGVNLQRSNLTDANLSQALVTNTDFTDATIRGADLTAVSDFTAAQLYSTASYQSGDLSSVELDSNDLTGWDLSGLDFTGAKLSSSTFTHADLSNTTIRNAELRETTSRGLTSAQFYSTASYQAGDLSGVNLEDNDLSGWNFAGHNLTGANLDDANLTGANISGADVRDVIFARFGVGAGAVTATQLYSTASYNSGDLRGVRLEELDLSGWDFSGQSLRDAVLRNAVLSGADFTDADVRHGKFFTQSGDGLTSAQLYSTASYRSRDLQGLELDRLDLSGWNFTGQSVREAAFRGATLIGADFSGADIRHADFYFEADLFNGMGNNIDNGFSAEQLYSTASYQANDLRGIGLGAKDLTGWDFSEQNLSGADFEGYDDGPYTQIAGADFSGANLTNTIWSWVAEDGFRDDTLLFTADFTGADTRQSVDRQLGGGFNVFRAPNRRNLVQPDGSVDSLDIQAGETFRVWDLNSESPVPIVVQNSFQIDDAGVLRIVIEDDQWGSIIRFDAGFPVTLGGTLELLLSPEEGDNGASIVGETFKLFDWTGVSPVGQFDQVTTDLGAQWDTSQLYITGEVTLLSVAGIPEPSTLALSLATLCLLIRRYR
ncbi:pentapeptide repeat-containing protein [Adhaeretor mobilis]|uniref:pentapeptide repeat-containing protein n=1 Tax=Adhaeretor mobilis TaxID=1930276 RepID=UPI001C54EF2B|nr:pentapeptide repeat-containing protein [Adhaeretor mobilis]